MTPSELQRFEAKVRRDGTTGCWLWTGALSVDGYGRMRVGSSPRLAHRLSYEHHVAPISDGMFVLHRCDVPGCVNPAHLFLGTNADNMSDMVRKGRSKTPRRCRGERVHGAKLTADAVRAIRDLGRAGVPQRGIAARVGVSQRAVLRVLHRKTWRHVQ